MYDVGEGPANPPAPGKEICGKGIIPGRVRTWYLWVRNRVLCHYATAGRIAWSILGGRAGSAAPGQGGRIERVGGQKVISLDFGGSFS